MLTTTQSVSSKSRFTLKPRVSGILPAIASPCDERGVFLEDRFAALAAHLVQQGVQGLYVCGNTGDGYKMRLEERKRAAEIAVEVSRASKGTVIVHVGSNNESEAMKLAEHAATAGAAAVSSMPPPNLSHAQLADYYAEVARAARLPMLIYHVPAITKHSPTLDEMLELLDVDGVVGLKFSDYNLFFLRRLLLARPHTVAFSGNDEILCLGLQYGAQGGIGMTYNLFPRLYVGIYKHAQAGDIAGAMELQNLCMSFLDVAFRHGIQRVFELLMRERGFAPRCFRQRQYQLDDEWCREAIAALEPCLCRIEEAC